MTARITPSVIAKSQDDLEQKINLLKDASSVIHLDIADGVFVANESLNFDFKLPKAGRRFEAHLMVQDPDEWVKKNWQKIDAIIIPIESCRNPKSIVDFLTGKKKFGFSLNPQTPISKIQDYLDKIDEVLVMTVEPGFYGSRFLPEVLEKVRELRRLKPKLNIKVDGAMNPQNIKKAFKAGANYFVSGSYVINSKNPKEAMANLRSLLKAGFTLVELLVVISIIGLLASIVLVSTQGVREKANITKVMEFSSQLDRALGAYAVGWWNFDDSSAPQQARDFSLYGNQGVINGAAYNCGDTPYHLIDRGEGRCALSLDGANDYVDAGAGSSLNISGPITIAAWVKFNSFPDYPAFVGKMNSGTTEGFRFFYATNNKRFYFETALPWQTNTTAPVNLVANTWYHVAVVASNSGTQIYLNGKPLVMAVGAYTEKNLSTATHLSMGWAFGTDYFNGLIDEVRVYNKALNLSSIQQLYAYGHQ